MSNSVVNSSGPNVPAARKMCDDWAFERDEWAFRWSRRSRGHSVAGQRGRAAVRCRSPRDRSFTFNV